jgi:hypothetical protein
MLLVMKVVLVLSAAALIKKRARLIFAGIGQVGRR